MSINIPDWFVTTYQANVAHLLQYKQTKLRGHVMTGSYSGEQASVVDQIGPVEMMEVVSRFGPMPRVDAEFDRRWVFPRDFHLPQMIDTFDKLRLMTDPQSSYAMNAVFAANRRIEDIIFGAFYADAKTGKNGGTTEQFDDTNHRVDAAVGASADTGLNVDKIKRALRIMKEHEVDLDSERAVMAITPEQEENLLSQMQVISTDFFSSGGRPVMVDGKITQWGGVDIIVSTRVPANASYRLCPLWVKSGMHLGIWDDVKARADTRPDIEGVPYQLYTHFTMDATRLEPGRVIQIECTEE